MSAPPRSVTRLAARVALVALVSAVGDRSPAVQASVPPLPSAQEVLGTRRAKLERLAGDAWGQARRRARLLYRIIRGRDIALSGGTETPVVAPSATAVSVGLAALTRDLEEAQALAQEVALSGRPLPRGLADEVAPLDCVLSAGATHGEGDAATWRIAAGDALRFGAPIDGVLASLPPDPDGRALTALTSEDGWVLLFVGPGLARTETRTVRKGELMTWRWGNTPLELEVWRGAERRDPSRVCRRFRRL